MTLPRTGSSMPYAPSSSFVSSGPRPATSASRAALAHGRSGAAGAGVDIDDLDLDRDPLAGALHLDEDVEPGVGNVDHGDLPPGVRAGDGAPQGGLAAAGGSGDADGFHFVREHTG